MSICSYGQTYKATQPEPQKRYNILLRINGDSTVNFIYDRDENAVYAEHTGTIKKLNDTLFHISVNLTFGQYSMKSPFDDTLVIQTDTTLLRELDKITLIYSNGLMKILRSYDISWFQYVSINFPIDKNLFNDKKGTNHIVIHIDRKNPVTAKQLKFKIPFGSSTSFTTGQKVEFDITITHNKIKTSGSPPGQTGNFILTKH